jgi:hypothetical protein
MKQLATIIFAIVFILTVCARGSSVTAFERISDSTAQLTAHGIPEKDSRASTLRGFLAGFDSPIANDAEVFVREADRNNLDWRLVAAIAGAESTFGKHIPTGSYNAWGWGVFTGTQDGIHFADWAEGIAIVSEGLRKNYLDKGATDLYEIGWIYAANGQSWGDHVGFFMEKITQYVPTDPAFIEVNI